MKTVRFWLLIALAMAGSPRCLAWEGELARFGRPLRLEIDGAKSFAAEEIRQRLLIDLDVANACYPTTSAEELCELLAAKTREAYLYAGFADVMVHTAPSAEGDRLQMTISEGREYLAGEIVVRGLQTIDAAALTADMTSNSATAANAWKRWRRQWPTGKPTSLHSNAASWFREEIETRLLELGRRCATFTVEIVPDRERGTAKLVISFSDEGAEARLDDISIQGNKKNSREDVLAFLALRPGMICRGDLETDVRRKLWESGRFIKSTVKLIKPSGATDQLKLAIDLVEYENGPRLTQPLSREEAALVKLGCWLNQFGESDDEVTLKFVSSDNVLEIVAAPRRGYAVTLRTTDSKKPEPFTLAFVMSDERIGLYSTTGKRKLEGIPTPARVRANIDFTIHDGPPKLTGQARLTFGLGLNSKLKSHGLCRVRFDDTPVSLLSLAHEYGSKLSWEGDVLTVSFRDRKVSTNSATGQLSEFRTQEDGSTSALVRTEGEFQRRLNEIDAVAASFEPVDSAAGPLAGALGIYCDTALTFLTQPEDAAGRKFAVLIRKMSNLGILEPIDRLVLAACRAPAEAFCVPDNDVDAPFWKRGGEVNVPAIKYVGGHFGMQWSDLLTTPGTWLWQTWREAMFALAGKSRHLEQELVKHLSQHDSGPIRHLIVGELLRANDMQAMAGVFGLAGQAHLTPDDFRNDYLPLLDEQSFIGHCLLTWADVIRQLDEADIQTLCKTLVDGEWMGRGDARIFADLARRLRHDRASPVPQALSGALDAWWKAGLREYVSRELRQLAAGPRPTTGGDQMFAASNHWRYRWHQGRWWYYGQNQTWQYWSGNTWQPWPATAARHTTARR